MYEKKREPRQDAQWDNTKKGKERSLLPPTPKIKKLSFYTYSYRARIYTINTDVYIYTTL